MKATNHSQARVSALALTALLLLAACSGPGNEPGKTEVAAAPAPAESSVTSPAGGPALVTPPAAAPVATHSPDVLPGNEHRIAADEPAATRPEPASVAGGKTRPESAGTVSLSCKTNADCAIKDIGSCCGYNPRCVNQDSPTFPERVQAQCGKDGRMSVCGFPSITACECVAGKCAGITLSDNSSLVQ